MKKKRVLGIDPGSRVTGYGIVEELEGKLCVVAYGVLAITKASYADRLKQIYDGLKALVEQYRPSEVALETLFFAKNAGSAIKLGQARGATMTAVTHEGLRIVEYTPTQIKQAIVGYGHATKEQIQKMVCLLLGIDRNTETTIPWDATDALATAICHIHSQKILDRIMEKEEKLKR